MKTKKMEQIAAKRSKVVVENNNTDDLISSLPDGILHHIMSLLPPRYATSTSILSRRWETIWLSFPFIDLNESEFSNRENFCSCLRSTSVRHNLSDLQNLRLRVNLPGSSSLYRQVCEFMNAVSRDGKILKKLDIQFTNYSFFCQKDIDVLSEVICIRPKETFLLCVHLIFLRVEGCKFEGCPRVDLPNLKTLHLKNMCIHEEFLVELINGCPVVDTLSIEYCFGIENFRICHPVIENLVLGFRNNLETLELNMPGVKCINFHALANSVTKEGLLKVLGYQNSKKILAQNLETLCLECLFIEPDVLHNFISIFPKMEKLDMHLCDVLGRAQLHSKTLTSLVMSECMLLDEVDIRAYNLQNVEYVHNPDGIQFNHKTLTYITRLTLFNINVEHETLWVNSSTFPLLVSLKLSYCMNMEYLRIASNKLESLDVCGCEALGSCMIVAPQLLRFTYSGEVVYVDRLVASRKLHVALEMKELYGDHKHVGMWSANFFVKFLEKIGASAASMTIEVDKSCTECLKMIKGWATHASPTSQVI